MIQKRKGNVSKIYPWHTILLCFPNIPKIKKLLLQENFLTFCFYDGPTDGHLRLTHSCIDLLRRFGLLRLTTPTFATPTFVVGPFGLIIESVFIFIILEKKIKKDIEYNFFQLYFFLLCLNFHIYKIYLSLGLYGINTKFRHQKIIPKSKGKALKIANYTAWKY